MKEGRKAEAEGAHHDWKVPAKAERPPAAKTMRRKVGRRGSRRCRPLTGQRTRKKCGGAARRGRGQPNPEGRKCGRGEGRGSPHGGRRGNDWEGHWGHG